ATSLNQYRGTQTIDEGIESIVGLATLGPDGPSGGFFGREGGVPWGRVLGSASPEATARAGRPPVRVDLVDSDRPPDEYGANSSVDRSSAGHLTPNAS